MAKFCSRCGSLNDEGTGLCPSCDSEQLAALQAPQRQINFCRVCGTPIDQETGSCPNCTKPVETAPAAQEPIVAEEPAVAEETVVPETPAVEDTVADEAVVEQPVAVAVQEAPTVQPEPIVEAPVIPVKYAKKRSGAGKVILTIFLSLLLFITSLLSVAVICVRHTTSEGAVLSMLEDVDYTEMLNSIYTETDFVEHESEALSFTDYLSDYFEENHGVTVSDKQIEAFIEDSTVMDFFAEKVSAYVSDLYNGTEEFKITMREVRALLHDNADILEEHFDVQISDESVEELADWLVDEELLEEISTSVVKDENSAVFYALNIGFSYLTLAILLGLVLLCLVGMGLNDLSKGAMGAGIVFVIIGGILTALTLVVAGLPVLLGSVIGESLISALILKVLFANLWIFASVLGLGVLILVVRYIVRRFVVKPRKKVVA